MQPLTIVATVNSTFSIPVRASLELTPLRFRLNPKPWLKTTKSPAASHCRAASVKRTINFVTANLVTFPTPSTAFSNFLFRR